MILIASLKTLSTAGTRKRNQMQWSYDSAYLEEEGIPVNTHQIQLSEVGLVNYQSMRDRQDHVMITWSLMGVAVA